MGLSALQVALFAALVILVSGASLAPRSAPKAQQMRNGGGGGGGGGYGGGMGFGSGFGGGFGEGSSGRGENAGGNDDDDDETEGDGDEDDSEIGGDGGEDGDEDGGDSGEDDNGVEDGGDLGEDGDDGDSGDGGSTDGVQDGSDSGSETADEDENSGNDAASDTDDDEKGDDESSGCGCHHAKSTKSSDTKWKRNTRLTKSPDMGESSIPSSLWQSAGKKAPRSYYYGYFIDGNLVYEESEGGASHLPPQDISNIITVIPWLFNPFMRGLALKITPLGSVPGSFIPMHRIAGVDTQLRFKRDVDMEDEEEDADEPGVAAEDPENEEADSLDMGMSEDQGLEVAAEEDGIDSEAMDASDGAEEEEMQEEVEGSGAEDVMEEVVEEQLNIAQQAMDPSLLEPLMLGPETTSSDAFRNQARAVRSMERDNVVEDLNVALKTNVKSVGSPRSAGGSTSERSTRLLGLDLGKMLDLLNLQLNVGR